MKTYDFSNGSTNPYEVEPRHKVIPPCIQCGEESIIKLDGSDYFKYFVQGLGYVQTIFHYLNAEQRDLLQAGIHPECSDAFYGREEDEEEDD